MHIYKQIYAGLLININAAFTLTYEIRNMLSLIFSYIYIHIYTYIYIYIHIHTQDVSHV